MVMFPIAGLLAQFSGVNQCLPLSTLPLTAHSSTCILEFV